MIRTTRARSIELRERMHALLREYSDDSSGDMKLAILVSLHPVDGPVDGRADAAESGGPDRS